MRMSVRRGDGRSSLLRSVFLLRSSCDGKSVERRCRCDGASTSARIADLPRGSLERLHIFAEDNRAQLHSPDSDDAVLTASRQRVSRGVEFARPDRTRMSGKRLNETDVLKLARSLLMSECLHRQSERRRGIFASRSVGRLVGRPWRQRGRRGSRFGRRRRRRRRCHKRGIDLSRSLQKRESLSGIKIFHDAELENLRLRERLRRGSRRWRKRRRSRGNRRRRRRRNGGNRRRRRDGKRRRRAFRRSCLRSSSSRGRYRLMRRLLRRSFRRGSG